MRWDKIGGNSMTQDDTTKVYNSLKVDSHILRYDAARHEAVRQDAAKTHGCCSHMQRLPLSAKQHSFESSGNFTGVVYGSQYC